MTTDKVKDTAGEEDLPPCALELNAKQRKFCQEYLIDLDGCNAYDRAGYTPGSANSARTAACRLLGNPNVLEYVAYLKRQRSERTKITQDRILTHLAQIGFSDIKDFVNWDGRTVTYRKSDELPDGASLAISEFTETVSPQGGRSKSIKLYSKLEALKLLARHVGLFDDLNSALALVRKYGYELVDTYTSSDVGDLE